MNEQSRAAESMIIVGTPATLRVASAALRELAKSEEGAPSVLGAALVDDAIAGPRSIGRVPILGAIDDLPALCERLRFDTALLTLPRSERRVSEKAERTLRDAGVRVRRWEPLQDALRPEISEPIRPASRRMLELVGRSPRPFDDTLVRASIGGRRVLVTGAGGSIGSELARLIAHHEPEQLDLMDRSENALFEIHRQLSARFPTLRHRAVLHDVTDEPATLHRLKELRPDIVLHAAAHKHVPMMEDHPAHAIDNNVFGVRSVLDASIEAEVERFVLISTDKAVEPSSVMGATKHLAELYVRSRVGVGSTRCSLVRFGNVLGSACSVLPIWEAQLAEGGPITVTDERMTRYFMTIPEAATLVLQAAALDAAEAAQVLVLDMGEPVRILDLAQRFIESRGLRALGPFEGDDPEPADASPNGMPIVLTGARPGEKLHEQLTHRNDELSPTRIPGVLAWPGQAVDKSAVDGMIEALSGVRRDCAGDEALRVLRSFVPSLSPVTVRTPLVSGVQPGPSAEAA